MIGAFDLNRELRRFPLPEGMADVVVNRKVLAKSFFGVSENTISDWLADGMPVLNRGRNGREYQFQLSHCHAWRHWFEESERLAAEEIEQTALQYEMAFRNDDEADPNAAGL